MKTVQQEAMRLHQQLSDVKEAEEKAKEEVQRLRTALEITTSSKVQDYDLPVVSSMNRLGFKYSHL